MSFAGLLLTYGLNTWLPQIMGEQGYGKNYSLTFLLVLNLARDRRRPARVVRRRPGRRQARRRLDLRARRAVACPAAAVACRPRVLFLAVALAGVGTIGTQVLIYGLVSNYYPTNARAAGVAWCAGFGRLGGIVGPIIGGVLVGAGVGGSTAFQLFAAVSLARRAGDPARAAAGARRGARDRPGTGRRQVYRDCVTNADTAPVLVARDAELTDLEQRLLQVGELGPGLVLVTGPGGIGHERARAPARRRPRRRAAAAAPRARRARGSTTSPTACCPSCSASQWREPTCWPPRTSWSTRSPPCAGEVPPWSWSTTPPGAIPLRCRRSRPRCAIDRDARMLVVLAASSRVPRRPATGRGARSRRGPDRPGARSTPTPSRRSPPAAGVALHPTLADRLCRFTGGRPARCSRS